MVAECNTSSFRYSETRSTLKDNPFRSECIGIRAYRRMASGESRTSDRSKDLAQLGSDMCYPDMLDRTRLTKCILCYNFPSSRVGRDLSCES